MKILVLGGRGMAGHVIAGYLRQRHDVWSTVRGTAGPQQLALDATDEPALRQMLEHIRPDVVINAIGLLNEDAAKQQAEAIYVNSLLPHRLAQLGDTLGFRLVHISTDCVFSGAKGRYTEQDPADGMTMYARTKLLGEVHSAPHLTIRTSIIGPELKDGIGLFHWFMSQTGTISGYDRVFWNGVTTLELAKAIEWALRQPLSGLVHLAAPEMVSKYELLSMLKQLFARDDITIVPYSGVESDKSLVNTRSDFTFPVCSYAHMLPEMRDWIAGQAGYPAIYTHKR